jgi:hypothetical protein
LPLGQWNFRFRRRASRTAAFVGEHTAVFGKKSDQTIHVGEIRTVIEKPAIPTHVDESRSL